MSQQIKVFGQSYDTVPVTDALLRKYKFRFMVQLLVTDLPFKYIYTQDPRTVGRIQMNSKMEPKGRVLFVFFQPDGSKQGLFYTREEYTNIPNVFFLRKEDMIVLTPGTVPPEEQCLSDSIRLLTNQPVENLRPYADVLFDLVERLETHRLDH